MKPDAYKKDIKIDYVGIEIPNDFVVGYGLDYDGLKKHERSFCIGSCLNLCCNNCYDVFLSEKRQIFAEIVGYYLEKFNEFVAEKTHNKISR